MVAFCIGDHQRTRRRVDEPKNFGPPKTNFVLLEQRSSCGAVANCLIDTARDRFY